MNRKMFRNSYLAPGVNRVPAHIIEKWGSDHGFHFPKDFVDFFVEFGGTIMKEEYGYEFFYENNRGRDFAAIMVFLHFDPDVVRDSVEDQYTLRCTDHWEQPLLVPFAETEANTFAVLDFRNSRHDPAICNADFFDYSEADRNRPNMTWLAGSFTEFLDLLEPAADYDARTGE